MRVLVLCDDYWHPAKTVREGLAPLVAQGFSFDFIENAADWSPERMAGYPVTILAKSDNVSAADQASWMTPEAQQAFVDYVSRGRGLLAIHSGTAGYEKMLALRELLGGVFTQHPPQCAVTVDPQPDHPLTANCGPFTAIDEHYFMALDDTGADIFLTTTSEHGIQPGGWRRTPGQGRVCVLTPGHNLEVWLEPSFQALVRNALTWCAEEAGPLGVGR